MKTDTKISKRLALWLRHQPQDAGLSLTEDGWAKTQDVLNALERIGLGSSHDQLQRVVDTNDKKRFEFSEDGDRIRARQGHSVKIDLGLEPLTPPDILFHGTATRFLPPILNDGLKPMNRHHVHLSADTVTALNVGTRHGKPAILKVAAGPMHAAGHAFFQTGNGVWLTEAVPPTFLELVEG
ncbi:RNA 2'-phosphotransferase [Roseibium sediminicola]|uniref:Probable RNA 2'-phosphotransferase n=1 Tax=Roseibium sediminicola TaxID=2933272 RepID=A0ABT0GTQ4_9HYPH|nr:RNA 2'-phosphotransferase [Roseibium sp. CAU 1639]MCK7612671.1 RNA 2'-phosphotransferase [Roseibium sp. CAU 1639]